MITVLAPASVLRPRLGRSRYLEPCVRVDLIVVVPLGVVLRGGNKVIEHGRADRSPVGEWDVLTVGRSMRETRSGSTSRVRGRPAGGPHRGLEVAEAASATGVAAVIEVNLAHDACLRGQVAESFAILERSRALAEASGDCESDILLKMGRFDRAAEAGLRAMRFTRESGRHTSFEASIAISNAAEAMLAQGHAAEAAELIDPLTDAPANPDRYRVHGLRAEIDLLRGHVETLAGRRTAPSVSNGWCS